MAYSDIVTLRQSRAAYNIKEEGKGEWKSFIANDQFNNILKKVVGAVRNNDADLHKSIWIAGTYGTGKSHAGAVIQHLLCDEWSDVAEYVEEEYKDWKLASLRTAVTNLRKAKRLFPVNMYGQQSIAHEEDLSLQLQSEIKRSLAAAGLDIVVKTDFDSYVSHIEADPDFWASLIERNPMLESYAPDVNKLKQLLANANTDVLDVVRDALRKGRYDIRLESHNLLQWVMEVQSALRTKGYSGLLIVWDEFTEVMTSGIGTRLLVQLQQMAETMMSAENDSYFLFISHPSALNSLREEEREKTKGRYHYLTYNMEPVSAFKIMSKKFKVVDEEAYEKRKRRFFGLHGDLLDQFSSKSNNMEETRNDIANLFPIHPGTANLATFYAREAGSSSRSVFEFLADDVVRNFLDDEEAYADGLLVTADYLWDYVKGNFEADTAKFGAVTERFNTHHLHVENRGARFLKVFKGILLLNALNNIANADSVTPSAENIRFLFAGTPIEGQLPKILEWFNEESIIQRQPNGNFSILFTALPGEELQKIKERLKSTTYLYTDQVVKSGEIVRIFFQKAFSQVFRPKYVDYFGLQANEYTLMNKVENAKKSVLGYEVFLAILFGRNATEVVRLKEFADKACRDERFQDVAFFVVETPMGDKEYERFIEYKANAECAQSHNLPQQMTTYNKQADSMLEEWMGKIRGNSVTLFMRADSMVVVGNRMASTVNAVVAPSIFMSGPESLDLIQASSSATHWKKASVKSTVDAVLNYHTKQDIIGKCGGAARHVEFLLQDSVDDNLEWKPSVSSDHPLKKVCDYVDEWLSGKHTSKNQSFNLGEKLKGLTEPPYGLFQSYAPMAMVAFAMRKYVNVIYDTNGKQRSAQHLVDDVVELFKSWENGRPSNKLNFMFEGKEAGKVSTILIEAFALDRLKGYKDISSLKDARWALLHEYCNEKEFPLWSLKYCDDCSDLLGGFINNLIKVATDPESMKNPSLLNDTISGYSKLKFDFGNLLSPAENNFYEGFVSFIKSDELVKIDDVEIDSVLEYLRGHLQSEVGLWEEDGVKEQVKNWRISLSQKQTADSPNYSSSPSCQCVDSGFVAMEPLSPEELEEKRETAICRIQNSGDLQEAIERMIKCEDETIISILLKYV